MAQICEKCERSFKSLTKDGLCAYCHHNTHGKWAKEFSDESGVKVK